MLSYKNDPKLKSMLVDEIEVHRKKDAKHFLDSLIPKDK